MSRHHLLAIVMVVTALVIAGAVFFLMQKEPARNSPTREQSTELLDARWKDTPCKPSVTQAAQALTEKRRAVCGHVRVPEGANSRRGVEIAVIRLIPESSAKVPLLLVAGGPGDAFSYRLEERLQYFVPLSAGREILVVDQRGTGESRPLLECTQAPQSSADLVRCFAEWNADVVLATFNTKQSATDIARVLETLNLEQVGVYGVSYGTHLALTFAQSHPERVESLLLDSPISPKQDVLARAAEMAQAGFQKIIAACHEDGACGRRFDINLEGLSRLALQMNEKSARSGTDWLFALSKLSLSPEVPGLVPLLVEQAKSGDFSLMNRLRAGFSGYRSSLGLHLSIQCAEFFSRTTAEKIEAGEAALLQPFREAFSARQYEEQCRIWRVPAQPSLKDSEKLKVPALVLSGGHDPVTPPEYGQDVAENLATGRHVVIQSATHAAALSDCGAQVGSVFLNEGLSGLRDHLPACVDAPLKFFETPPDQELISEMVHHVRYRL